MNRMSATPDALVSPRQSAWFAWLTRELAPVPGREIMTLRLVLGVVLVTLISMTLQTPETAVSAYMVFFVTKQNRVLTMITGIGMIIGVTIAIVISLLLYRHTFDHPELRIPLMAATVFAGMYISRVFVVGALGFAIGFVVAVTQSAAELAPNEEILVRALLWLWMALVFPIALTVVLSQIHLPGEAHPASPKPAAPKPKKPVFVADALTNLAYPRFALKVALASMTCYVLYTALDWSGIHTAFITCIFIALESADATMRKGWLRLIGCLTGGLLGFLAIMYLIPHMESIVSLLLLTASVSALAGWVAAGSERISYAGLQIAFAFFMCIFQGFAPDTNFTTIRDRIVGIVLGIVVTALVFRHIWPDQPVDLSHSAPASGQARPAV